MTAIAIMPFELSPILLTQDERFARLSPLSCQILCFLYRQGGALGLDDLCTLVYELTNPYDFSAEGDSVAVRQQYLNSRDAGTSPLRRLINAEAGKLMGMGLIQANGGALYSLRCDPELACMLEKITLTVWTDFPARLGMLPPQQMLALMAMSDTGKADLRDPSSHLAEKIWTLQSELADEPVYLTVADMGKALDELAAGGYLRLGYTGDSYYFASSELRQYLRVFGSQLLHTLIFKES